MPLQLPALDDRTYADLVQEGLRVAVQAAPDWTNHNASDPGITLLEVFAFVTEALVYRTGRVTEADRTAFARLLGIDAATGATPDALADGLRALRAPARLVTAAEFEAAALGVDSRIRRAHCLPRRDLSARTRTARQTDWPGYVSVAVVVDGDAATRTELAAGAWRELDRRRLLTVRVRVVEPRYVALAVRLVVVPLPGTSAAAVRTQVGDALATFLNPLRGGRDGRGWPFGGAVYTSDLYRLLDDQPGVDYVTAQVDPSTKQPRDVLAAADSPQRGQRNAAGELTAITLDDDELVSLALDDDAIQVGPGGAGRPGSGGGR